MNTLNTSPVRGSRAQTRPSVSHNASAGAFSTTHGGDVSLEAARGILADVANFSDGQISTACRVVMQLATDVAEYTDAQDLLQRVTAGDLCDA